MLEITFGDATYEWDWNTLLMSELREVKKLQKWTRQQWLDALREDDPDAVVTLIYLIRKRNGEQVRFDEIDAPFDSYTVRVVDEDEEGEPDPPQAVEDGSPTSTPTTPTAT